MTDRSRPGDLSPIWRMLAVSSPSGEISALEPIVRVLPDPDRPWQEVLRESVAEMEEKAVTLIVAVEGRYSRAILSLMAHGRMSLGSTPAIDESIASSTGSAQSFVAATSCGPPRGPPYRVPPRPETGSDLGATLRRSRRRGETASGHGWRPDLSFSPLSPPPWSPG